MGFYKYEICYLDRLAIYVSNSGAESLSFMTMGSVAKAEATCDCIGNGQECFPKATFFISKLLL